MRKIVLLIFFLCGFPVLFAQESISETTLMDKAYANTRLIHITPEEAFKEMNSILLQAKKVNNREVELIILKNKCVYFELKTDFENLLAAAELLQMTSTAYKDDYYVALSYIYLSHAYAFNELESMMLDALSRGLGTVEKSNLNSQQKILLKGKFYTEFANIHYLKREPREQVKYVLLTMNEYNKLEDSTLRKQMRFMNYSHLASSYYSYNLDSARFYAQKSIAMNLEDAVGSSLMFMNYLALGGAHKAEEDYEQALHYFNKADSIKENVIFFNVEELYKQIIEILTITGDTISANKYTTDLSLLKLEVSESKNRSLHKIIEDTANRDRSRMYLFILGGSAMVIFILFSLVIYFRRKNRLLAIQEAKSQEYLEEQLPHIQEQSYKELIEVIKENDPAFMFTFQQTFPKFTDKLISIYPQISKSELEFCALIKLKLTTKEIARYKMIHFRTVQNRKYHIRKQLNIPQNVDIYDWFHEF